jgi:putative ABC transport system permease protein
MSDRSDSGSNVFDTLVRDLRFARRSLARTPLVTGAAIGSIALGIAASTGVFAVVDAALLRPPPFVESERLGIALITRQRPGEASLGRGERWSWSRARLLRRARSFESVATFTVAPVTLTGDQPVPASAELVSSSYWSTLRVRPIRGRAFEAHVDEEDVESATAIISYALWQRQFGGDPSIVGRSIAVNGVSVEVVGVAPPRFSGLSGRADVWLPATMAPRITYAGYLTTNQNFISVVARLRNGVSFNAARAELAVLGEAIQREVPSDSDVPGMRFGATVVPLADARIDASTRRPLVVLAASVACLLALSCANVAGLLLGRVASRRREIAIRIATGATRARIVQQLLVESALIAVSGTVAGLLAAMPVASQLMLPPAAARGRNFYGALGEFAAPRIDVRVATLALLLTAITTIAFGLLPALRATRLDLTSDLKDGAGAVTDGRARGRSRQIIVALETGLAALLLFCGGSLVSSWQRLSSTDLGFDPAHVVTFMIRPSEVRYPVAGAAALIDRVLDEIRRLPEVVAVSVDGCTPVGTGCASSTLFVVGRPVPRPDQAPDVLRHYVAPDHFRVLGVPLLRGRSFDAADRASRLHVAIIDELAARRFWPNQNPIGQRVWFGSGTGFDRPDSSAVIVGVVGDVAYQSLDEHPYQPNFYTPYAQFTYASRTVLVRLRNDPAAATSDLRRAVRRTDPNLAPFDLRTMDDVLSSSWARLTYQIRLVMAFAVFAALLAGTGLFAVIAQAVGARRREIGIRVALGATPSRVARAIGVAGALPALIGLVGGLAASWIAGRALAAMVYGARAFDPSVLFGVATVSMLVIAVAAWLATRSALAVDAADALRAR